MAWPIRVVDRWQDCSEVGDAAYVPDEDVKSHADGFRSWRRYRLSTRYERDHAARRTPIVVRLPDGSLFCVDSCADGAEEQAENGWTVTGDLPTITVSPSINVVDCYHGWIQNGVITDDCEGRTFPTQGRA